MDEAVLQSEMTSKLKESTNVEERISLLREMEERCCHRLVTSSVLLAFVHDLILTAAKFIRLKENEDETRIAATYAKIAGCVIDRGYCDGLAGRINASHPEEAATAFSGQANLRDTFLSLWRFYTVVLLPDLAQYEDEDEDEERNKSKDSTVFWENASRAGFNVLSMKNYFKKAKTWKQSNNNFQIEKKKATEKKNIVQEDGEEEEKEKENILLTFEDLDAGRFLESYQLQAPTRTKILEGGAYNLACMTDQTKADFLRLGGKLDGFADNRPCEYQKLGDEYLPWICGSKLFTYNRSSGWVMEAQRIGVSLATGISHSGARLYYYNRFLISEPDFVYEGKSYSAVWLNVLAVTAYLVHLRAHSMHEVFTAIAAVNSSDFHYSPSMIAQMIHELNEEKIFRKDF